MLLTQDYGDINGAVVSVLIQFFVTCIINNTVTPFYSVACIPLLAIQQVLHLYIIAG